MTLVKYAILATLLSPAAALAQPNPVVMEPDSFDLTHARSATFEQHAGRTALCLDGPALIEALQSRHGTLRADILNTGTRAFANIIFHAESAETYEAAYLRLHKSGQPDAVQYTPHIGGESHWQLLGDAQAMATYGDGEWLTLEVAFDTDSAQAAISTSEGERLATLDIADLRLNGAGDRIGLNALFGACYSNIQFDPSRPDLSALADAEPAPQGVIEHWSVSATQPFTGFPAQPAPPGAWRTVPTEPDGFVYFSRYGDRTRSGAFEDNLEDMIYAGVQIESDDAQTVPLQLDASDKARVWLNGRPLAEFDNSFRRKGLLFRGDVDPQAQTVFLPLQAGSNTLVIAVAERANGWGLAAILPEREGLAIRAMQP